MAQSFLNTPGLPLGLRNNNPGNLRPLPGNTTWQGEIEPDRVNNFSRFSDVGWGLRAMITDITGDIVKDGLATIRKLTTEYAPPSENNTTAYINAVSKYMGIGPDQVLTPDRPTIEKLIRAKLNVELGPQYAALINQNDVDTAFNRLSPQTSSWLGTPAKMGLSLAGIAALAITAWAIFRPRAKS
jgi:hypothetical protein